MSILSLAIFIGILFSLVIIHELGHFLFAKWVGMRVDEFAFGFPPRLWYKKVGETTYAVNLLPLGGYVKIFGEQGLDEKESTKEQNKQDLNRSFDNKNITARLFVLAGGVIFNFLACVVLLAISFYLGNLSVLTPEEVATTKIGERQVVIVSVQEKSNLFSQGLREGDVLLGIKILDSDVSAENLSTQNVISFIQKNDNQLFNLEVQKKSGEVVRYAAIPQAGLVEGKKILGIGLADVSHNRLSFVESINKAGVATWEYTKLFLSSFGNLIKGLFNKEEHISDSLSGPVGMAVATKDIGSKGVSEITFFAAMISLSLAVFNILPIPALDGGRIIFVLSEIPAKIIWKRKLPKSVEQTTHALGFLFLIGLMIFVTYFDILKLFK